MPSLLPNKIYRLALRLAHVLRHRWRLLRKARLSGVTMIARDPAGGILLVRHSYGPSGWYLPGGGLGRNENPEAAAIRELREETGCSVTRIQEVGVLEDEISGSPHSAHIFTALTMDEPVPDRREILEARFFPPGELPDDLSSMTRARLAFWLETYRGEIG